MVQALAIVLAALLAVTLAVQQWRAHVRWRRLVADNERLALVARQTSNAVVITDRQRRVTWVNPAFEQLTGYALEEMAGHNPGHLLQCPGTDRATVMAMREALDAGQRYVGEILNRSRDGRLFWVGLRIEPMRDAHGWLSGFMAIQTDVTARRSSEAALRASQDFMEHTGRIGGVGGWSFDPASGKLNLTRQVWRLLGETPRENPTLADCLRRVGPQSRAEVEMLIADGLSARDRWDVDLQIVTGAGQERWLRVIAESELDAAGGLRLVGTAQDVSVRRAVKAEALHNASLLRNAIETIDEAFVLYDPDDRLVICNDKYRALFARPGMELLTGVRYEDILRAGVRGGQYPAAQGREDEWVAQRLQVHRSGGVPFVQRLDDGRVLRVVDRVMPDGHVVGFRVDITDLVRATEAAEEADRSKSEFIGTISHELRTPLQSILGFSDLGRHFAAGHPQFEPMFRDIHDGGTRMLRLVNGLLDISKIDGTLGSLVRRPADLGELALAVVRELRPQAGARRVEIVLPEAAAALTAEVDAFRMQQVLRNVLANAIRFAPEGSSIEIAATDLGAAGRRLEILDRGPGIPEAEIEAIFKPFVQSSRTKSGAGGTGLGLAICRRIMGAHGGRITAANRDGGGARFTIELPAPSLPASASSPATEVPSDDSPRPRKSLRQLRSERAATPSV
ncbi:PAS-domain containing protein [Rubrivivax sp. JA1024]|nr:PAS-domain containing protein [Rubrivivax sp. JA1024]